MADPDDHSWLKSGSTSSADVKRAYDDWADSYDETLESWDYRAPRQAAAYLRDDVASDAVILDAGCGTGLTGLALREAGFDGPIDGIDLSAESLNEAEKRGIYRNLTAVDLQSTPLPVPADRYDALICIGSPVEGLRPVRAARWPTSFRPHAERQARSGTARAGPMVASMKVWVKNIQVKS